MTEVLLWLILLGTTLTAVLLIVLLVRASKGVQGAGKELRDDLRTGREETRTAAKELREEVSTGLKLANDTVHKTLAAMACFLKLRFDAKQRISDFCNLAPFGSRGRASGAI